MSEKINTIDISLTPAIVEDVITPDTANTDEKPVEKPKTERKSSKQTKKCPITGYIKKTRTVMMKFGDYGISVSGVDKPKSDTVTVEYSGKVGTDSFKYRIV